jgi:chromosome partitioning protein
MPVISSVSLKGGAGKSTLCHQLLGAFGLAGQRVLAIDCDPQSSLSTGVLGTDCEQISVDESVVAIFSGSDPLPSDIVRPSGVPGVDIIPGSRALDNFNLPNPHLAPPETQGLLRTFLDEVRGDYDLVIVDTPPNLYACCYGALTASDYCIVPTQPQNYDVHSLSPVMETIRQVQQGPNPSLVNLGVVLSRTKKSGVHTAFERTLRAGHGPLVFDVKIAESVQIQEAILAMKPVTHFKPKGESAKQFKALAEEVMARIVAYESGSLLEVAAHG